MGRKTKKYKRSKDSYGYEHRDIYEAFTGQPIPKGWEVHHVNTKHRDNRIENLIALPKVVHQYIHNLQRYVLKFKLNKSQCNYVLQRALEFDLKRCDYTKYNLFSGYSADYVASVKVAEQTKEVKYMIRRRQHGSEEDTMQDTDDNVKTVDFTDKSKQETDAESDNYALKMHKEAAAKRAAKQAEIRKQNNINTKRAYRLTNK